MDPPGSRVQKTDPAYVHKVFSHQTYQPYLPHSSLFCSKVTPSISLEAST